MNDKVAVELALTADDLARLKLDRQAAIIRRWAEGGKLTPDEMAEVHPILPLEFLARTPSAICPHVRTRLRKSYDEYAAHLGVGLRTVKRWAALGKKAGDPCPLDDLAQLPAWWGRNMSYAISAALLAICTGESPAAAPGAPPAAAGPPPPAGPPGTPTPGAAVPRASINVNDLAAIGLHENLNRLSRIHHANIELLEKAFSGSSENELTLRQRNVQASGRMLKDAQQAFDAYQESRGELAPVAEVKADLQRVHTAMAQSLVSLLVGLGIARDRATTIADRWFRHLRESRFAADTLPDLSDLKPPPVATAA